MTKTVHQNMKLGKQAPRLDPRTFKLSSYLKKKLPPPPATESWIRKVPYWPMFLNDQLGDCVIAAMGHMIQQWTYYASQGKNMVVLSDAQILQGYRDVGGYVPGDPSTDNGCVMLDALKYWRRHGLASHKILAFVSVDPLNIVEVQQAVYLFGNLYAGMALPLAAQEPVDPSKWTVPTYGPYNDGSPGSWGGHCIPVMASSAFMHPLVTWGQVWTMTRNFRTAYCDELYAVLSTEWIEANGLSPSNFNLAQLQADLIDVAGPVVTGVKK